MVPINIKRIEGKEGQVRMPDVGVLVGWFSSWSMTKAKDSDQTYRFSGTFGHVNPKLWEQDYRKVITLKISSEKTYQLCQAEGANVEFSRERLVMESVSLCPAEES